MAMAQRMPSPVRWIIALGLGALVALVVTAVLARGSLSSSAAVAAFVVAGGVLALALIAAGIAMGRGERFGSG